MEVLMQNPIYILDKNRYYYTSDIGFSGIDINLHIEVVSKIDSLVYSFFNKLWDRTSIPMGFNITEPISLSIERKLFL